MESMKPPRLRTGWSRTEVFRLVFVWFGFRLDSDLLLVYKVSLVVVVCKLVALGKTVII